MPNYIIHHNGVYNFYSTIVDAPVFTGGLTLEELEEYYQEEYGRSGMYDLPGRLERAHKTGCSSRIDKNLKSLLEYNRAGPNETTVPYEEFIERYLTIRPDDEEE